MTPQSEISGPTRRFKVLHNHARRRRPARGPEMVRDAARGRPTQPLRDDVVLTWTVFREGAPRAPVADLEFSERTMHRLDVVPRHPLRMRRTYAASFAEAIELIDAACARSFDGR